MSYDLLIKYASRDRPEKFRSTLTTFLNSLSRKRTVLFVVSMDEDDQGMNSPDLRGFLAESNASMAHGSSLYWYYGPRTSKHEAMNRDIDKHRDWRVLAVAQDDVVPAFHGWDDTVVRDMDIRWPDGDGCLFYRDGLRNDNLCTMSIMGRPYFDRFGYIYNPVYKSLYADNEHTEVADSLGKLARIDRVVLRHDWHSPAVQDDLRKHTESFYGIDGATFKARKALGFPKEWPVKT